MISIVVPVYCGKKTLPQLTGRIGRIMSSNEILKTFEYEMILVDDFSPDDSWKTILELAETNPRVRGIRLSKNYGQQNATYAGLHYASGEVIVTLDDDLQHEPEHIPSLIDALQNEETDLVYGVFSTRQDGEHRALGSKLTAYFFKKRFKVLAGQRVSSFRAFRASVKNAVIGKESGFVYISCLLLGQCNRVSNVRIPFASRAEGRSNYDLKKLILLYVRLTLNYGQLSGVYNKYFKKDRPAFEVGESVNTPKGSVTSYEGNDAGWRHKSAVCN